MITFWDIFMPIFAVTIATLLLLWVKKVNPDNKKTTTYYATKDLFRKEMCPSCGCKMKKTWKKEPLYKMGLETISHKEFNASPLFKCKKCGYEVKEKN